MISHQAITSAGQSADGLALADWAAAPDHCQYDERSARIGPNAVIRLIEALDILQGRAQTERIFKTCHLDGYLRDAPAAMVHEAEVAALHRAVDSTLGPMRARSVAWIAGQRTADYLLANRIPRAAQAVLQVAPKSLARRALLGAICRNAWTFAGSGIVTAHTGHITQIAIANCPLCRNSAADHPCCDYYSAVFERLFTQLIDPGATAREIACAAMGAPRCIFDIRWPAGQ